MKKKEEIKQEIIDFYKQSYLQNLENIKSIFSELKIEGLDITLYEGVLKSSSQNLIVKWKKETKYLRTVFAMRAFGENYRKEVMPISISIDAMINLLDDLLDENLTKEDKVLYIVEFLRCSSNFYSHVGDLNVTQKLGEYFNKLITLAVAENYLFKKIQSTRDFEEIVIYSSSLLMTRAMDIDVFIEIASGEVTSDVLRAGRVFRAVNILKKDILDFDHDLENGNVGPLIFVYKNRSDYKKYIARLVEDLESRFDQISFDDAATMRGITESFKEMFLEEKEAILNQLRNEKVQK